MRRGERKVKKLSPEHCANISKAKFGKPSKLKGRKLTPEHCHKIGLGMILAKHSHAVKTRALTLITCNLCGVEYRAAEVEEHRKFCPLHPPKKNEEKKISLMDL